jgi:hypothetical protein
MREELVRNFSRTWGYVQGKHWLVRIGMSLADETSAVRKPLLSHDAFAVYLGASVAGSLSGIR